MKHLPLTKGYVALVDDDDYERLSKYKWSAQVNCKTVYARRGYNGPERIITVMLHREIMNAGKGQIVDHLDRNGLNNQRSNLRIVTSHQNSLNRCGLSGFKGVNRRPSGLYQARITPVKDGSSISLGNFKTAEDAARAYDAAALKYFGEFAYLNFPTSQQSQQEAA